MPPLRPTNFNWQQAALQHRDCLPHLREHNALYYITFRLNDSLPKPRLLQLQKIRAHWLADNPTPHIPAQDSEFRRLWTLPIERLLDAGYGQCPLHDPACRQCLEVTLRYDDAHAYHLGDFVIMPNHAHILVQVLPGSDLSTILQAWKSISARNINRLLSRKGTLWQPEPFDRIVRHDAQWKRIIKYIYKNPAHLSSNTFTLSKGSLEPPPE